jgi:hypothetical protein
VAESEEAILEEEVAVVESMAYGAGVILGHGNANWEVDVAYARCPLIQKQRKPTIY